MSDCKSDGSISTYGGSNPPAAPSNDVLQKLWKEWLIAEHDKTLVEDRAWLHLPNSQHLVSRLVRVVDWHKAPGIWGLFIVPIKGYTIIEYKDTIIEVRTPKLLQTNILHRWIPKSKDNVFWAYKIKSMPENTNK